MSLEIILEDDDDYNNAVDEADRLYWLGWLSEHQRLRLDALEQAIMEYEELND